MKKVLILLSVFLIFTACTPTVKVENGIKPIAVQNYKTVSMTTNLGKNSELLPLITISDDLVALDYKLGNVKSCFIQSVTTPVFNDGNIKELTFTESKVTTTSVVEGVSKSISTERSTSMSSKSSSFNMKLNFEFAENTVSKLMSLFKPNKTTFDAGFKMDFNSNFQKASETIAENFNEESSVTNLETMVKSASYVYDFSKYETDKYYTIGLLGDVDVHQVIVVDTKEKNIVASYFYSDIVDNTVGLRMLCSDVINFSEAPEDQIEPISDLDIGFLFDEGDGSDEKPFLITNSIEFMGIANDLTANYILSNSIDFHGAEIGCLGDFEGCLDGNGFSVYNFTLSCSKSSNSAALFNINKGTVKNIVIGSDLYKTTFQAKSDCNKVAAIAGINEGKILNSKILNCSIRTSEYGQGGAVTHTNRADGEIRKVTVEKCYLRAEHKNDSKISGVTHGNSGTISNVLVKNCKFHKVADGGIVGWFDDDPIHYSIAAVVNDKAVVEYTVNVGNTCDCGECQKKINSYGTAKNAKPVASHVVKLSTDNYTSLLSSDNEFAKVKDENNNPVWIYGYGNDLIELNFDSML